MTVKLGLQTITWGDPQDGIMGDILGVAARSGFDGVEIGWRRIAPIGAEKLGELLAASGRELIGTHAGGNLVDTKQADAERQQVDDMLDCLAAVGSKYLMYSGLRYESDEQLAADIATINATAKRCVARGVRLLYHNHDWEFGDGAEAWRALLTETTPELGFCPDVGWLYKGGQDCAATLDTIADRVMALHFKEFRTREPGVNDFCCLGEGCVPFAEAADWAKGTGRDDLWVIAEQDSHDGAAAEAAERNGTFLRELFG